MLTEREKKLLAALDRLAVAAGRCENHSGDPLGMLAAQAELREAAASARVVIDTTRSGQ